MKEERQRWKFLKPRKAKFAMMETFGVLFYFIFYMCYLRKPQIVLKAQCGINDWNGREHFFNLFFWLLTGNRISSPKWINLVTRRQKKNLKSWWWHDSICVLSFTHTHACAHKPNVVEGEQNLASSTKQSTCWPRLFCLPSDLHLLPCHFACVCAL